MYSSVQKQMFLWFVLRVPETFVEKVTENDDDVTICLNIYTPKKWCAPIKNLQPQNSIPLRIDENTSCCNKYLRPQNSIMLRVAENTSCSSVINSPVLAGTTAGMSSQRTGMYLYVYWDVHPSTGMIPAVLGSLGCRPSAIPVGWDVPQSDP